MSRPPHPFQGKKIEVAPATGIDAFRAVADDFMGKIFEFEPGEYLITDESMLRDFAGCNDLEFPDIQAKVRRIYGAVMENKNDFLVNIFRRIAERGRQPAEPESTGGKNP
jgi:hypothetical protein